MASLTTWEIEQDKNKGNGRSVYDDTQEDMRKGNAPKIVNAKQLNTWEYIMDMRKWTREVPSIMAMSGKPASVGPADIKGPLMCLTSDRIEGQSQHSDVIDDLDRMDERFNELLEMYSSKHRG